MDPLLEIRNISKAFPGVQALKNVGFSVKKGEIHSLMGENGAGKSTLIKILGGVQPADEGEILMNGKSLNIKIPRDSKDAGIIVMHQEIHLVPDLDVATNIILGNEPIIGLGIINKKEIFKQAEKWLKMLNFDIDPTKHVRTLTFAEKQMVEIVRAVSQDPKVIIMDEPSASLTSREREELYKIIKMLRDRGVSIIYISHIVDEIFILSDSVTVLRDGLYIGTESIENLTMDKLITMMVGRTIEYKKRPSAPIGEVVLEVKNLQRYGAVRDVNFKLHKGEILGIAGLVGAGRSEIVRAIFGADKLDEGEIFIEGKKVVIKNPCDAFQHGITLVPEDRKTQGLQLHLSIETNLCYSELSKVRTFIGTISSKRIRNCAVEFINKFKINPKQPQKLTKFLSGGNQQKVVVGRCVFADPRILIIDEPTRGMDVGAKEEIHNILHSMAMEGKSVIMISSEMPEVLKMSDRILVVRGGTIVGELPGDTTAEQVLTLAMGSAV